MVRNFTIRCSSFPDAGLNSKSLTRTLGTRSTIRGLNESRASSIRHYRTMANMIGDDIGNRIEDTGYRRVRPLRSARLHVQPISKNSSSSSSTYMLAQRDLQQEQPPSH
jgi:hypothetical protein